MYPVTWWKPQTFYVDSNNNWERSSVYTHKHEVREENATNPRRVEGRRFTECPDILWHVLQQGFWTSEWLKRCMNMCSESLSQTTFWVCLGAVRLSPSAIQAINRPTVPVPFDEWVGTSELNRNWSQFQLRPPQIPHILTWDRIWNTAVGDPQTLTTLLIPTSIVTL